MEDKKQILHGRFEYTKRLICMSLSTLFRSVPLLSFEPTTTGYRTMNNLNNRTQLQSYDHYNQICRRAYYFSTFALRML